MNLNDNVFLPELESFRNPNNILDININSEVDFADFENNIIFNYNESIKNNTIKNDEKNTHFTFPFDLEQEKKEFYYDLNEDFIIINKEDVIPR